MKTKYEKVILTKETRPRLIRILNELLKLGICSINVTWGDYNPLTRKKFKHNELHKEGRAIKIDQPGPWKGDRQQLIRIPFVLPDCGRYFPEGTEFFFQLDSNSTEVKTKAPIKQWRNSPARVIDTFEITNIKLIAPIPYQKKDQRLIEQIEQHASKMISDDSLAMV